MRSNDGMLIINNFLEVADIEWSTSEFIDLQPLLLLVLLLGLKSFLILNEFFLHKQVVLDSLLSQ